MRHELTTRYVVVLTGLLLAVAVLFAVVANVEPTEPVDPEEAEEIVENEENDDESAAPRTGR